MRGLLFLFGLFLALGLFFLAASFFRIPTLGAARAMLGTVKQERKAAKTWETFLMTVAVRLARGIRMEEYKRCLLYTSQSMEKACQVIRDYADYEILPVKSLQPDKYARYLLEKKGIKIREELEPFFKYDAFGKEGIKKDSPVETSHGIVRNRVRAIPEIGRDGKPFRWYSPLTISCYNGKDGTCLLYTSKGFFIYPDMESVLKYNYISDIRDIY